MATLQNASVVSGLSGQGLTVEESAALQVGLQRRQNEEGLMTAAFWGKVTGTDNDYLVCVGYGAGKGSVAKSFYFAYVRRGAAGLRCDVRLVCATSARTAFVGAGRAVWHPAGAHTWCARFDCCTARDARSCRC